MRALKGYFSVHFLNSAAAKALTLLKRFPVSVLLVTLMTYYYDRYVIGITNNLSSDNRYFFSVPLYVFLTVGVFIATAAALRLEDAVNYVRQYAITVGVVLLWGLYCLYLPTEHNGYLEHNGLYLIIELMGIGLTAFLLLYFISFFRKDTDMAFWNFSMSVTFQYNLAACFGMIVLIGLCGALLAVGALFDIKIPDRAYMRLMSICLVLFAQLYFLANIPGKNAKYGNEIRLNSAVKALGLYVLAPLVAIYAAILYVYMFKIIIAWELPQGWVSWLVSTLACGGFLTVAILYPARLEEKNKVILFASRYFGVAMLPLLALMTVGIARRVSDYGITIMRGYLILLNIWLYWACLYHFLTKARRIKWLLISLTAVVLFSSLRFCGVPAVTRYILTAEVRGYTGNQKISVADSALFNKVGPENRKKTVEKIRYLRDTYGFESVAMLFESDVNDDNFWKFARMWESDTMPEAAAGHNKDAEDDAPEPEKRDYGEYFSLRRHWRNKNWDIEGYNSVTFITWPPESKTGESRIDFEDKQLTVVTAGVNKKTFRIPLQKKIRSFVNDDTAKAMYLKGNGYTVLIDRLEGRYYKSTDSVKLYEFEGYLFYSK
jgi:hypothetical protein